MVIVEKVYLLFGDATTNVFVVQNCIVMVVLCAEHTPGW